MADSEPGPSRVKVKRKRRPPIPLDSSSESNEEVEIYPKSKKKIFEDAEASSEDEKPAKKKEEEYYKPEWLKQKHSFGKFVKEMEQDTEMSEKVTVLYSFHSKPKVFLF